MKGKCKDRSLKNAFVILYSHYYDYKLLQGYLRDTREVFQGNYAGEASMA